MTATPRTAGQRTGPRKVGYARVSTAEQNLAMQIMALEAAGCEAIFTDEGVSGAKRSRPALDDALSALRDGDRLTMWNMDRSFRSLSHALVILEDLKQRDIAMESVTEAMDVSTPIGMLIFQIRNAVAEYELSLNRMRTRAGLEAARARGVRLGRPPKLSPAQIAQARQQYRTGSVTYDAIGREFGVSGITVSRAVNGRETRSEG